MAKIKNTANTEKKIKKNKKFKVKHYPCSYCSKTFSERAGRDHHLQLHSSERPFSCSLCPHTCKTKKYLAKHVRVVHKPPTSFKCEYCDKMFHYKCILDKHIVVHTNSKPHKCKECGKGFNSQYSLKSHILIHKNLKPFKCQYCEYACRDSSTLRRHQERHMGVVTRYHCNICDRRFSKKQLLQYHVAEVHMNMNLKKIPCEQCDLMFRTKKLLSIHVEVRHNRKFATNCEICGLRIANKYNMNSHLMSHVNVRPYKCGFSGCDKRYKDRSSLQKHSIIHYPEKQFPCKICGKKFTRKERLRKHKKQHVPRIKNVQCDYCGVCFYNKNYLAVHIFKKHSRRKKKFICDLCDFESGNKPGLIKHIKGHNMRLDKECPMCNKKYKDENWLKIHLWQAHKVMESNGTPTFKTDVKVEPLDVDGTPEFELFEIEKEEILEELHSINKNTNTEQNNVIEKDTEEYNVIQEENKNNILTTTSEHLKDDDSSIHRESSQTNSAENNDIQQLEYSSVHLQNGDDLVSSRQKCANENLTDGRVSVDNVANDKEQQSKVQSVELLVKNAFNEICIPHSNCSQIEYDNILSDSKDVIEKEENSLQTPQYLNSTKEMYQNDSPTLNTNEQYSQKPRDSCKLIHNLKEIQPKIYKVGSCKEKSLAYIKAKLKDQKKKKDKKKSITGDLNNKSSSSKRKSLAHIKAALLNKKQFDINKRTDSKNLSESEGLTYSKAVLSEDISRCKSQRKKEPAEKNFDDFYIEHIQRHEKPSNKLLEIDKDSESYAKNCVDKLLEKYRNNNEVKLIEKTRQEYNERIRKARKILPAKVSIKYFDKMSQNNFTVKTSCSNEDSRDDKINNEGEKECKECKSLETAKKGINYDNRFINQDICENTNNLNESINTKRGENININLDDGKTIKTHSQSYSNKECDNDSEQPQNNDGMVNVEEETETNIIQLCADLSNTKRFNGDKVSDNNRITNVKECRKIKLNTHQCYVCFKLFASKEELLNHCKDHFEVCNSTILKKCPLCDFATNLNIVHHMRVEHDVEITIPSTKIIDKESENGPRYCYKVNSATISDIDVIPSVKHLNKQAYMAIDKKRRKLKDTGIAKTRLVKKGKEWIVDRQTTKIDNVDKFILPRFDTDEILSVKIDSNDYLTRMKKLYRLAKKHKKQMLFPCESCDKICHTLSALKLHCRRHDPKSKPFRKKVWKHKMKDLIQPTNKRVTDIDYGMKKYSRVVEIDGNSAPNNAINGNRYKKPKPVVNKHKCDPELIKFYENNIKGGDIEFWQFLKIFNKMSRENINDFADLNDRPEFGIHLNETNAVTRIEGSSKTNNNKRENNSNIHEKLDSNKNMVEYGAKHASKIISKNRFVRIIRISKRDHQKRNDLKQKLREKIAKDSP